MVEVNMTFYRVSPQSFFGTLNGVLCLTKTKKIESNIGKKLLGFAQGLKLNTFELFGPTQNLNT